jgi:hypothetical protein
MPPRLVDDVEEVRADGHVVEVIDEHPRYFVLVKSFELPSAYEPSVVDLMVMTDYQYPMSALDMFWTNPHVRLNGAYPQNADNFAEFIGRTWQRWSWHYEWNPAAHNLRSHLEVWFDRIGRCS